jgi:hypothetical protein
MDALDCFDLAARPAGIVELAADEIERLALVAGRR